MLPALLCCLRSSVTVSVLWVGPRLVGNGCIELTGVEVSVLGGNEKGVLVDDAGEALVEHDGAVPSCTRPEQLEAGIDELL